MKKKIILQLIVLLHFISVTEEEKLKQTIKKCTLVINN